jgi:hypothetical protein
MQVQLKCQLHFEIGIIRVNTNCKTHSTASFEAPAVRQHKKECQQLQTPNTIQEGRQQQQMTLVTAGLQ